MTSTASVSDAFYPKIIQDYTDAYTRRRKTIMANFAFAPHPRMNEVLRKYDLRDRLQLGTFLEALHYVDSEGSELYDYIPPDVTLSEWDELYDAYLIDEEEIHQWRERESQSQIDSGQR